MVAKNRQIKTGHDSQRDMMNVEVVMSGKVLGKEVTAGEIITCTKSEAKRLLSVNKKMFKITLD